MPKEIKEDLPEEIILVDTDEAEPQVIKVVFKDGLFLYENNEGG